MIKSDYISRAVKFYNSIKKDIEDFRKPNDYRKYFRYFNQAHKRAVKIANGCARVAIITSDYVIKIDCGDPHYYGGCEDEIKAYEKACKYGVQDAFAPITKIASNVYVMPRCTCNDYNNSYECCTTDQFYAHLTSTQWNFIRRHITDIHNGNIGLWHRKIVLVDYAANNCR